MPTPALCGQWPWSTNATITVACGAGTMFRGPLPGLLSAVPRSSCLFAQSRLGWDIPELAYGMPLHDIFVRVFSLLNPAQLEPISAAGCSRGQVPAGKLEQWISAQGPVELACDCPALGSDVPSFDGAFSAS